MSGRTEGTFRDLDTLVADITDGMSVVVPADTNGIAMAATRALIRRGIRHLHLIGGPTSGLQADLLIGAGAVDTVECAAVYLGELGIGPRFRAAAQAGRIEVKETTCPAVHAALQAAEKGIPFMPLRGIIGSDVLERRADWHVVNNPYADDARPDPVVLIPALIPDVALFHVALTDRAGNVWVGRRREVMTMARAAKTALVTAEAEYEGNLLDDPRLAPGVLPALYVGGVSLCPQGSLPVGLADVYPTDVAHLRDYAAAARSDDGFAAYLDRHVYATPVAA